MTTAVFLGALALGFALGFLAAALWRARREQDLKIAAEVLRQGLANQQSLAAEKEQDLARTREQLGAAFGDLANESLRNNSEVFLQLARERFARQQQDAEQALKERQTAIESLVAPIRETLVKAQAQIEQLEKGRIDAFAGINKQMELLSTGQDTLSRETRNLVTALRRPEVRGQWGEMTLRRLVELAGMTEHVDFTEQHGLATADGVLRPDMIVHMPDNRDVVVDVKTPLDAYLAAVEAQTEGERAAHLRRHAQNISARIRELAQKQYWSQFDRSPDFVVLFLPGDQFLSFALQDGASLMDEAMRQNVILATPTSLVALLKAVAFGWKQSSLAANAEEIRKLGEDLYKRLAVFGEHLLKLGKSLTASVDAFNKAVGSLEHQVLPAARRFPELGMRADRRIEVIEPVVTLARTPSPNEGVSEDEPTAAT